MEYRPRYSMDDDLEAAEEAARQLPEQIARLRAEVRKARQVLSGSEADDDSRSSSSNG